MDILTVAPSVHGSWRGLWGHVKTSDIKSSTGVCYLFRVKLL